MKKTILSAAALALTVGFAAVPLQAAAKDRYPSAAEVDTDKDGMISKEEYLAMAAKRYDDAVAKMMKMPAAEQAKMVKDYKMTFAGYEQYWRMGGGQ
jgi:hypothetical protein